MSSKSKHTSLLLVEGDTEIEFYSYLADTKFPNIPKRIKNLHGNFSINNKIVDAALSFSQNNADNTFDVYVCVDQERIGSPPFNFNYVLSELQKIKNFRILNPVIAVLMIESLFFIDIDGIYTFLRAKKTLRNPKKYANFRVLRHQELSKLFKTFGNNYSKGIKCQGFVQSLNIDKICGTSGEIASFIEKIHNKGKLKKT